jgi:putative SOS response-associated peptidase YedK
MCGRFAFYSPAEATAALFGAGGTMDLEPRYNIAPTQHVASIRSAGADDERELVLLRWGLVPFWAKDPAIGNRMINARAETVAEKPAFRAAFRRRRCLVLADGFYEWHREGSAKTPYYVSLASEQPFAFAGLWERWQSKESDDVIESATLITAGANAFMSRLHHRMPVILEPPMADRWLAGEAGAIDAAIDQAPRLRAWPVDRSVNSPRNEGERLVQPAGDVLAP